MRRVKRFPLEQLAPYLLDPPHPYPPPSGGREGQGPAEPVPLAWSKVFGNERPVEVEVGFGKGLFLLTSALSRPEVNFLGIELERKYQLYTAARLAKRGLGNVRLIRADARLFVRDCVASSSVQALHIYFPDPWWKTRHRKRRLFTPEFVRECSRVLQSGGRLELATDVEEYFKVITHIVEETASGVLVAAARQGGELGTNFERKAREMGTCIHRAVYTRIDG